MLLEAGDGLVTLETITGADGQPDLEVKLDRTKIATVGKKAIGQFLLALQVCAHMHTRTHAHTHTRTHVHMHTCTHAHMHTCTHAHMQVHKSLGDLAGGTALFERD